VHGSGGGRSAATVTRPIMIFSIPFTAARKVKAAVLRQHNHTAEPASKPKFAGADADAVFQKNATSWEAVMPRTPRPFRVPGTVVARMNATLLRPTNVSLESQAKIKFTGPNLGIIKAQQNQTSRASSMSRPLKVFHVPVVLAGQIRAAIIPPKSSTSRSAPKLKFMGANPATIKSQQNQTSSGAGLPRPPPLFRFPVIFAKHVKATLLSVPGPADTRNKYMRTACAGAMHMCNVTDSHRFPFKGNSGAGAVQPLRLPL
jgi:hypothetical protein